MVTNHDEVNFQRLSKRRYLIHWVSDCEVADRDYAELRELVHSFLQDLFGGLFFQIEGHGGDNFKASHPRSIVEHGKEVGFGAKLMCECGAKPQRATSFTSSVVTQ
jgi:hypothetical protein